MSRPALRPILVSAVGLLLVVGTAPMPTVGSEAIAVVEFSGDWVVADCEAPGGTTEVVGGVDVAAVLVIRRRGELEERRDVLELDRVAVLLAERDEERRRAPPSVQRAPDVLPTEVRAGFGGRRRSFLTTRAASDGDRGRRTMNVRCPRSDLP